MNPVSRGGSRPGYIASRLKRDYPAIAEAVARGEYRSLRAAGIAAGFIKARTTITLGQDTRQIAKSVVRLKGEEFALSLANDILDLIGERPTHPTERRNEI